VYRQKQRSAQANPARGDGVIEAAETQKGPATTTQPTRDISTSASRKPVRKVEGHNQKQKVAAVAGKAAAINRRQDRFLRGVATSVALFMRATECNYGQSRRTCQIEMRSHSSSHRLTTTSHRRPCSTRSARWPPAPVENHTPPATAVATISPLNERCLFWPRSAIDGEDRYTAHIWVEGVATGTLEASRSRWPNGLICRSKRTPGIQARKCWVRSLRSCLRGNATRHHSTFTPAAVTAITPSLHRSVALTSATIRPTPHQGAQATGTGDDSADRRGSLSSLHSIVRRELPHPHLDRVLSHPTISIHIEVI